MSEEQRQKAKEEAVLLALQNDMALIRRDLEIHGMKKTAQRFSFQKAKITTIFGKTHSQH